MRAVWALRELLQKLIDFQTAVLRREHSGNPRLAWIAGDAEVGVHFNLPVRVVDHFELRGGDLHVHRAHAVFHDPDFANRNHLVPILVRDLEPVHDDPVTFEREPRQRV